MSNMKKAVAVFDFDGTLTLKDSFIEFAIHAVGKKQLLFAILKNFRWLAAWKLGKIDGGVAKERLFATLYKDMPLDEFRAKCVSFTRAVDRFERKDTVNKLRTHLQAGHDVYIISASISDWIIPWAKAYGIHRSHILATEIDVTDSGHLTGRFSTPNCIGEQKVARLKTLFPDLSQIDLYAYGDSAGDYPLLSIADHPSLLTP